MNRFVCMCFEVIYKQNREKPINGAYSDRKALHTSIPFVVVVRWIFVHRTLILPNINTLLSYRIM